MPIEYELIRVSETPPGGYKWTEPTTGKTFEHYDYTAFTNAIRDFHIGNEIPLAPDWREQVKSDMCVANMPAWRDFCRHRDAPKGVARPFSIESAKSFVNFMKNWRAAGGGFVSQEEAEDRSKTCAGCEYMTQDVGKCGSCYNFVLEIILNLVKGKQTAYQEKLGNCGICSCALKVATWMPLEPQQSALDEGTKERFRRLKSFCWKAQGL